MKQFWAGWICFCAVCVLCAQCARQSSGLTGGLRDTVPPVFLYAEPAMNSTGFHSEKNRIDLYFDEYLRLQNVGKTFMISPPMSQQPDVVLYGKYIRVKLPEAPQPDYTYTLSFGETILDNNEGNKMGFFEYVFSTSDHIDSLVFTGRVRDAFDLSQPSSGDGPDVKVLLYNKIKDSIPYLEPPSYVARADQYGFFEFNHLRPDTFLVFALQDVGDNLMFNLPEERIAFLDTLIVTDSTFCRSAEETMLFHADSIREKHPDMIPYMVDLYLFQEPKKRQYRTSYNRDEAHKMVFTFNLPMDSDVFLSVVDTTVSEQALQSCWSPGRDTLQYWILDTVLIQKPVFLVALTFQATNDSLRILEYRTDTLRMQCDVLLNPPTRNERSSRRNRNASSRAVLPPHKMLTVKTNLGTSPLDLNGRLDLLLSQPVSSVDVSRIQMTERVDSLLVPVPITLEQDTLNRLRYHVHWQFKEESNYRMIIDTMAFTSIYGVHNDSTAFAIKTPAMDFYSNIQVTMHGVRDSVLVQVFPQGNKQMVKQLVVTQSGVLSIAYLKPGKYQLKAVHDANGNGQWDTGDYLQHRQPERVDFYPDEIQTESSFTTELDWILK